MYMLQYIYLLNNYNNMKKVDVLILVLIVITSLFLFNLATSKTERFAESLIIEAEQIVLSENRCNFLKDGNNGDEFDTLREAEASGLDCGYLFKN